jgi:L-ascorbate metabolism protein UlaG (beta-lactamase superfamily)
MEIQYVGHSCFRLRGKEGIVITDPFHPSVGFPMPSLKADVVTVSHSHADHNNIPAVKPTQQRARPFIIEQAGEYEVSGISVYGYPTWHDNEQGAERGSNIAFSIFLDDVHILHLGDLGHLLDSKTLEAIPEVDILLCPVGGVYTIDSKQAAETISSIEPSVVIPMHYRTPEHAAEGFGTMATLEDFMKEYGKTATPQDKFVYSVGKSVEEVETQLVVLQSKVQSE